VAPTPPQRVFLEAAGLGQCPPLSPDVSLEIYVEVTTAEGHRAPWLVDEWWIQTHSLCGQRPVTIVIMPTPHALLDDVLKHQLEMVRRIVPEWRLIGYATFEEAHCNPNPDGWTLTPYDEIRFCGEGQPTVKVERLVAGAAQLPRVQGRRRACLRLSRSTPQPPPPAAGLSSPADDIALIRRVFNEGTVEST
jgi:hypothetical protein